MIVINEKLIEEVAGKARLSLRRRMNYNFHEHLDDPLQRMLNCLEPDTYIQPHKHEDPDKCEAFILLKGRVLVVEFDDDGNIAAQALLEAGTDTYGAEIAPRVFHTIVAMETTAVVYEIKNGPYSPLNDKNFACWAPKEGDANCSAYRNRLIAAWQDAAFL